METYTPTEYRTAIVKTLRSNRWVSEAYDRQMTEAIRSGSTPVIERIVKFSNAYARGLATESFDSFIAKLQCELLEFHT